eukprot:gene5948-6888_t
MSAKYDRAITVFSPDGHLFQVEYAMEAVRKGTVAVGVRGKDVIILGVEKKSTAKLQDARSIRKIVKIDDHICLTFAGLTADSRFDSDGAPKLYQTDPSGSFSSWKAAAIGRNSKTVSEFLEKNYTDESDKDSIKLAVRALLEVVESGNKNIEIAIIRRGQPITLLEETEVEKLVDEVEKEKDDEKEATSPAPKK